MLDVGFDFRSDANGGDPDRKSPTLKKYHLMLWNKPLSPSKTFTVKSGGWLTASVPEGRFCTFWILTDFLVPNNSFGAVYGYHFNQASNSRGT
jgi:hypothetical protein